MRQQIPQRRNYPDIDAWANAICRFLADEGIDNEDALQQNPPIGSQFIYPYAAAPSGYLLCDGATYASARYPILAKILGSVISTFAVPTAATYIIRHD